MSMLVEDLRKALSSGDALVIAGAGVALAGTDNAAVAGWRGLLENGVERCADVRGATPEWVAANQDRLATGDVESWVSVAEQVTATLGGPAAGEFKRWLSDTVGGLRPSAGGQGVLEAVVELGATPET